MTEVVVFPALFTMVAFVVWTLVTGWERRQRVRAMTDFSSRLLDRLGSVSDFNEFVRSDAGKQLMDTLMNERPAVGPKSAIVRTVQIGTVVLSVAAGMYGVAWIFNRSQIFMGLGIFSLFVGGGLLISAFISHRLAIRLGLLDPRQG